MTDHAPYASSGPKGFGILVEIQDCDALKTLSCGTTLAVLVRSESTSTAEKLNLRDEPPMVSCIWSIPRKKSAMTGAQSPLLLCPEGSCLEPSNAFPGSLGSLSSFFVCRNTTDGTSTGASSWLPATGTATLAGFAAAGFHTTPCNQQRGSPEADCAVCSWVLPNALPTRALADRCAACNGVHVG